MDSPPGARSLVETSLGLKEGEVAAVLVDEGALDPGRALVDACRAAGAAAFLVVVDVPADGAEPPEAVVAAMVECDAAILATTRSLSHTAARREATRAGTRVVSVPGITAAMLDAGALTADHGEVEEAMAQAHRRLRKAEVLRLTAPGGTDLTLGVGGHWITGDTGRCLRRGAFATFPAGELLVAAVEGSAEGTLVADVYLHAFLRRAATATVREGYAVRVDGASGAEEAMDAAGREGRHLSRLGLGFNAQASASATPLEATKALGALHVGFGDNTSLGGAVACGVQVEAVAKGVSVEADGETVLERGRPV